ncbi:MAG: hypothetical protein OXQ90_21280 [Gammaproteobacteria bacterium]|nr:hypothetical protein [Gammaproteobacteria bacterium]
MTRPQDTDVRGAHEGVLCAIARMLAAIALLVAQPAGAQEDPVAAPVHLFPADDGERQGFVRLINSAADPIPVEVHPYDDAGTNYPTETVTIPAEGALHFNAQDLRDGNATKGLVGVGAGVGDWRLVLLTEDRIEVMAYVRTNDGFLSSVHDTVPGERGRWVVPIFNPARNPNQISLLRVVNGGEREARVTVTGTDDAGAAGDAPYHFDLNPGAARTVRATDLEAAFGGGTGKWRLVVEADRPIAVMNLLESPTGHLTNLSTVPPSGLQPVLKEDHLRANTIGEGSVPVSVVDAQGFEGDTHGTRVTDTFLDGTAHATLVQIDGWCSHELNGVALLGPNFCGYIRHVRTRGTGIFWTASHQSPTWEPTGREWLFFIRDGRPFARAARRFAEWAQQQNVLYVSGVENATCKRSMPDGPCDVPVYCDDFDPEADHWEPLCGAVSDYMAHTGTAVDNALFVGAIRQDVASGAISAEGVFAPHTIYVESRDGSTSHATPVLAAYATNLAHAHPGYSAARLKLELLAMAREETLDYRTGAANDLGNTETEPRTIRVIRPSFAP